MYLLIIAVVLLLLYLLLGGFSNIDSKRISAFIKSIRWYLFSFLCLLLGLWLLFTGKAYLSWVALAGLLPLLKRLLLGAFYFWGIKKVRDTINNNMGGGGNPNAKLRALRSNMTIPRAEQLLGVTQAETEDEIITAYLKCKKQIAKQYKDEPDIKAQKIQELEAARDRLLVG
ncbi:MAG: hypothetical protein K0U45_04485 [Alphaproteobacteria bacterium]|nr:hypothetical protein [Alphaproteobacteria bacterium]